MQSQIANTLQLPTLIRPLCTLPLPASQHPITQITFHPTQPLILLQTSDRAITALRLRSVEEVESKRARRKKREREKGKKKGEDGAGHEVDDAAGEVRWEERVTGFCVVRANAKIKSFSLAEEEPTSKGGISVS
jgi:U3 small nucleolar RNA-associated protein 12